jgi:hypothetical protein
MKTLSKPGATLELNPDLAWTDEFQGSPIKQTVTTLFPDAGGKSAIYVEETALQAASAGSWAGRAITLASGAETGMMTRAQVSALKAWEAESPEMTLAMTGYPDRAVRFRQDGGAAVTAAKFMPYPEPGAPTDFFSVQIKLIEV